MEWNGNARDPLVREMNASLKRVKARVAAERRTTDAWIINSLFFYSPAGPSVVPSPSVVRSFVRSFGVSANPARGRASVGGRVTRDSNDRSSFIRARSRPPLVQSSSFTSFSFCIPLRMVIICLPIFFIGPRMQMPHPTWMTFFSTDETKTDPLAMHFFVSRPLTGQRYDEARHRAEDLPRCPRFLRLQRLQG